MKALVRNPFVMYGCHHAITGTSDGYAIRSHSLAKALCKASVAVKLLVPPSAYTEGLSFRISVDGVDYLHLRSCAKHSYQKLFSVFKPDAVLAASNWSHAQPMLQAARQLCLPFWYEARGFWELSRCAREQSIVDSTEFQQVVAAETAIAQAADRLFTLNRPMAAEWQRRGVAPEAISLIPNGITAIPASPSPPDPALRAHLGLRVCGKTA